MMQNMSVGGAGAAELPQANGDLSGHAHPAEGAPSYCTSWDNACQSSHSMCPLQLEVDSRVYFWSRGMMCCSKCAVLDIQSQPDMMKGPDLRVP